MLKGVNFNGKNRHVLKNLKQKYWAINYDISSVKGSKGGGGTKDEGRGQGARDVGGFDQKQYVQFSF